MKFNKKTNRVQKRNRKRVGVSVKTAVQAGNKMICEMAAITGNKELCNYD